MKKYSCVSEEINVVLKMHQKVQNYHKISYKCKELEASVTQCVFSTMLSILRIEMICFTNKRIIRRKHKNLGFISSESDTNEDSDSN